MNKKLSFGILSVVLVTFVAFGIMAASSTHTVFADNSQGQCNKAINGEARDFGIHGPFVNDIRKEVCSS